VADRQLGPRRRGSVSYATSCGPVEEKGEVRCAGGRGLAAELG